MGYLVSGILHCRRYYRLPSGAEGRVAASAHRRLVLGRFSPPRGLFRAARFQLPFGSSAPLTRPDHRVAARFDIGTPDGYQFFLDVGPGYVNDYLKNEIPFWNKIFGASQL